MAEEAVMADAYLGEDGAFQENWLDSMPEDTFEKDDTGKLKQGDLAEHKNLSGLAKSYLNAQKLVGTAIQPFDEKTTAEQKRAVFTKFGCPEKVEGYDVAKPELPEGMEWDEELVKNTAQYAHDNGISKTVFEGLFKMNNERRMAQFKQMAETAKAEQDKTFETATNELKGRWGSEYDGNVEKANRFYNLPGDDKVNKAFVDLLESKGIQNHPATAEFMCEAYKLVKEDDIPGGTEGAGKTTAPGQLDYSTVQGDNGR